jgi:hypothetical protein
MGHNRGYPPKELLPMPSKRKGEADFALDNDWIKGAYLRIQGKPKPREPYMAVQGWVNMNHGIDHDAPLVAIRAPYRNGDSRLR